MLHVHTSRKKIIWWVGHQRLKESNPNTSICEATETPLSLLFKKPDFWSYQVREPSWAPAHHVSYICRTRYHSTSQPFFLFFYNFFIAAFRSSSSICSALATRWHFLQLARLTFAHLTKESKTVFYPYIISFSEQLFLFRNNPYWRSFSCYFLTPLLPPFFLPVSPLQLPHSVRFGLEKPRRKEEKWGKKCKGAG